MGFIWRYDCDAAIVKKKMNPVYVVLLLSIVIANVVFLTLYSIINGFDWIILYAKIITLHPDEALLTNHSILLKIQFVLTNLIILVLPFTHYLAILKLPRQQIISIYKTYEEWSLLRSSARSNQSSTKANESPIHY